MRALRAATRGVREGRRKNAECRMNSGAAREHWGWRGRSVNVDSRNLVLRIGNEMKIFAYSRLSSPNGKKCLRALRGHPRRFGTAQLQIAGAAHGHCGRCAGTLGIAKCAK